MLAPDPRIFQRDDVVLYYEGEWTREAAARILSLPNIMRVGWKVDGGLSVQVWPKRDGDPEKEVNAALGRKPAWQTHTPCPKQEVQISYRDLIVIDALIDNARSPMRDLVASIGLSPKTIRKHLKCLLRNRLISPRPRLGALSDTGEIVFQILVFGNVAVDELRKILNDAVLVNRMETPPTKYLLCLASDLDQAMSRTRSVEKLPGVESVTITLNRESMIATDFLHLLVKEEMKRILESTEKTV
jgi:DNA-binding Lrp family transcriptional regulator